MTENAELILYFPEGVGFRFRLSDAPNWREGAGSVVYSHMFQHVGCGLKGRLTNRVHADRVPTVTTYHKSPAHPSGRCVHALSLHFKKGFASRGNDAPNPS
jgi:hypothetical protein